LPSAREIQVKLFLNKQTRIPDNNNQLLMQWGQFVAHDVSNLAIDTNGEGNNKLYLLFFLFKETWSKPLGSLDDQKF